PHPAEREGQRERERDARDEEDDRSAHARILRSTGAAPGPRTHCPQIAAKAFRGALTTPLPPRRFAVHRARDASRSKPVTQALRASGRSMWQVDESVTGSVNFFWSAKRDSAGAESRRG